MGDTRRRELGRWGEQLAERYLADQGLRVLDRNWRCRFGEIDIVALDGDCVVVCEVKTRSGTGFGAPVEAITWPKYRRLRRLTAEWLAAHPAGASAVRIDVIGVHRPPVGRPTVSHHVGVVR